MNTAIVLGITGTLGQAVAQQLDSDGFQVVGVARNRKIDNKYQFIPGDLTQSSDVDRIVRQLEDRNVCPAALVHCIGVYDTSHDECAYRQVIDTNLVSAMYAIRAFGQMMCASKYGRIVLVSSITADRGSRSVSYSAAKAALRGVMRSTVCRFAENGVTINIVMPGPISSPMLDASCDSSRQQQYLDEIPMHRFAEASEVASVIAFLCSRRASYVTGIELPVSGGLR